jgi:hypothetical protein
MAGDLLEVDGGVVVEEEEDRLVDQCAAERDRFQRWLNKKTLSYDVSSWKRRAVLICSSYLWRRRNVEAQSVVRDHELAHLMISSERGLKKLLVLIWREESPHEKQHSPLHGAKWMLLWCEKSKSLLRLNEHVVRSKNASDFSSSSRKERRSKTERARSNGDELKHTRAPSKTPSVLGRPNGEGCAGEKKRPKKRKRLSDGERRLAHSRSRRMQTRIHLSAKFAKRTLRVCSSARLVAHVSVETPLPRASRRHPHARPLPPVATATVQERHLLVSRASRAR